MPPEYVAQPDGTYWRKQVQGRPRNVKLANFSARIVEDVKLDDGSGETQRMFAIEGSLGRAQVPAKTYNNLQWVSDAWGCGPTSRRGRATGSTLPTPSQTAQRRRARGSRSTRTSAGARSASAGVYLHAGDGVGAEVRLEGKLARYTLPAGDGRPSGECARRCECSTWRRRTLHIRYGARSTARRSVSGRRDRALFLHGKTGVTQDRCGRCSRRRTLRRGSERPRRTGRRRPTRSSASAFLAKDAVLLIDDLCRRKVPLRRTRRGYITPPSG